MLKKLWDSESHRKPKDAARSTETDEAAETVSHWKVRLGDDYTSEKMVKYVVKHARVDILTHLDEVDGVNLDEVRLKRSGFSKGYYTLLEYSQKKRSEAIIDYLKQRKREGQAKMYEYIVETDEEPGASSIS